MRNLRRRRLKLEPLSKEDNNQAGGSKLFSKTAVCRSRLFSSNLALDYKNKWSDGIKYFAETSKKFPLSQRSDSAKNTRRNFKSMFWKGHTIPNLSCSFLLPISILSSNYSAEVYPSKNYLPSSSFRDFRGVSQSVVCSRAEQTLLRWQRFFSPARSSSFPTLADENSLKLHLDFK